MSPKPASPTITFWMSCRRFCPGGRSARLYQSLVEKGIAQSASGGDEDNRDPYLMTFDGTPSAGCHRMPRVETALEAEITKLQTDAGHGRRTGARHQADRSGLCLPERQRFRAGQRLRHAMPSINLPHYRDTYLDKIRAVTPADIQRVAKAYLTADNRTVAYFDPQPLPPGAGPAPAAGHRQLRLGQARHRPAPEGDCWRLWTKKFNSVSAATAKPASAPKPTRVVLPNGMVLIVQENHANKTVAMSGFVRAGKPFDPDGKYGLAEITAAMLGRGTTTKTALQLALSLESVGASVGIGAGTESASVCRREPVARLRPDTLNTWPTSCGTRRSRRISWSGCGRRCFRALKTPARTPAAPAARARRRRSPLPRRSTRKAIPYWSPTLDESAAAIKSLTRDDLGDVLPDLLPARYRPPWSSSAMSTPPTSSARSRPRSAAGPSRRLPPRRLSFPMSGCPPKRPRRLSSRWPTRPQTSILFGYNGGLTQTSPDYYAAQIMNYTLGGDTFGSRLGKTIRDQNGLAYSVIVRL